MSAPLAVQTAIYTRLSTGSYSVFDHVPQTTPYPYIQIGEDTFDEWDTDTEQGFEATITVHCFSVVDGMTEVKTMQGEVYSLLHYHNLAISGYNTIVLIQEFSQTMIDPDGATRHGIQRFRLNMRA